MLLPDTISINPIYFYYIPFGINVISLLLAFLMLLTFLKYQRLRMNSGNLILSALLLDFLFSLFLFANFFYVEATDLQAYEEIFKKKPSVLPFSIINKDGWVCQTLGGCFIFLIFSLFFLNLCLTHNLYTCVRYKILQDVRHRFMKYLIFSVFFSIIISISAYVSSDIGSGELGYCGIKENSELEIVIFLFLAMIFLVNTAVGVYALKNRGYVLRSFKEEQNTNKKSLKTQNIAINNGNNSNNTTNKTNNAQSLSQFGRENLRNSNQHKRNDDFPNTIPTTNSENISPDAEKPENNEHNVKNMQFAVSNFDMFIKINLSYLLVFTLNWAPLGILSFWSFSYSHNASLIEDFVRLIGLYIMCSNSIFLFIVRITETRVKKKMTKFLFIRNKRKKPTENDIKSKLIKRALHNEKLVKQTSIKNTELSRFDSNFSFQMMMKSESKDNSNDNLANPHQFPEETHPETRAVTLHTIKTCTSKDFSSSSEEKAEIMNEMMKIFLVIPYLLDKLEKLVPETQFSEVLITSSDVTPGSFTETKEPPAKESGISKEKGNKALFLKAFSLAEEKHAPKDVKKSSLIEQSDASASKKDSLKQEFMPKRTKFRQPPWNDYLYNKYYLEEVELAELMKDSFEIMSKFKIKREKITCVAYNKEFFDWVMETASFEREELKKAFFLIENHEDLKKIEEMKVDLEIKTANSRFFLKIIHKEVKRFMVEKFFKSYHLYICQQKSSFLPKILGLFSFQFHSNNSNISFILYENPFVRSHQLQEKTDILGYLRINPLQIKKRIVFNEEKIAEHYHRSYSLTVKDDDLRLKKEEKNRLMGILQNDVAFLSALQAVKYSFVMFFYKYSDKVILQTLESSFGKNLKEDKTIAKNLNIVKHHEEDFELRNGIGYCVATFYEVFNFVRGNQRKKVKNFEKSGEILQSNFSAENAELYAQSLYDLMAEI